MSDMAGRKIQIHLAPWVVPVAAPVLRDGGVVIAEGKIVAVGRQDFLSTSYPEASLVRHSGVLLPGLVNSHCHLELGCLGQVKPPESEETFTTWVRRVIALRLQGGTSQQVLDGYRLGCKELEDGGCICCGDIGNLEVTDDKTAGTRLEVVRMLECLAPTAEDSLGLAERFRNALPSQHLVGHSVYTTCSNALKILKKRCRNLNQVFSLHAAESQDETRFVEYLDGPMRQLLEDRGRWDGSFEGQLPEPRGIIYYLDQLHLLDDETLLVHGVHLHPCEIDLLAERGVWLCLCPSSNSYLKVGRAPVEELQKKGVKLCLGTDSLASNERLDMWQEMATLAKQNPALPAEDILTMATLGGALALKRAAVIGSLETGKHARFLHVNSELLRNVSSCQEMLAVLVNKGKPDVIEWLDATMQ